MTGNATRSIGVLVMALLPTSCVGEIEGPPAMHEWMAGIERPSRADFEPVANALQASCGTLDCHGQSGRALRLFGGRGLRLSAADDSGGGVTTTAEYDAAYWSVVGLEPELLSAVVRDRGALPERLTMIAKARGIEKHKGGTLIKPRDSLDSCLTSWLAGKTEETACTAARPVPPPVAGRHREEEAP